MGIGDDIIATGLARGAHARGKRIAFGDRKRIIWGPSSAEIFRGNPNIANPGSEGSVDLEWIEFYKGHRLYVKTHSRNNWVYNRGFKVVPGEFFFDESEIAFAEKIAPEFVLIEPFVKSCYPNKQWPIERYKEAAISLIADGVRVAQFLYDGKSEPIVKGIEPIITPNIRLAFSALSRAALFVGPEGSLAHGAAAVGVRSVVIFGGYTEPAVVGYSQNINMAGDAKSCGSRQKCQHCQIAMNAITVDDVVCATKEILRERSVQNQCAAE